MSDRYIPDNEPRDILLSLEELAQRKLSHAPTFRKAAAEITRLRAENEKLRAATGSLVRSLSGCWYAFEPSLRSEMGNTNYHCVKEKMDEVEALLDLRAAAAAIREGERDD